MSRTKLERVLHVRVIDPGNTHTVAVRFYTQSRGVPLTTCVGALKVARPFWTKVLRPLLRAGAIATNIPVTLDVRPRGERTISAPPKGPDPLPNMPRLGETP